MTIYTELRQGPPPTIEDIWAANLTSNVALVSGAAKVVAICIVLCMAIWLIRRMFGARGGRIGRLLQLWLKAKERELAARANEADPKK